ncbi:NUDIX hydrolase [Oceanobacillus bengalensis]|uniref:CoA pyrophosphatase n=1 Tax=Oceanobacillus bengalensis TaxID=1435466 RepID=A0A494YZW5_9BACI|nr:CoA pyrophosphatase [Oceanobacillus bengalensis]RKQ15810.1 CoA pyrophosphatase [Oceanobacillus bengalensis]
MDSSHIIGKLKNRKATIYGEDKFFKSAVLVPLVEINDETHILFEVRSMQMRRQPGDICFPGGKIDEEDESPAHCAMRETTEELGLSPHDITDITPLDYIVSDMGRIIYPFVGRLNNIDNIIPNPTEVGEVFTVPLEYLLQNEPETFKVHVHLQPEESFPLDLIVGGENYQWQMRHIDELFYRYEEKVIWGLTAKILHQFITLIHKGGNQ